jgi:hypothetical protein
VPADASCQSSEYPNIKLSESGNADSESGKFQQRAGWRENRRGKDW